MTKFYSKCVKSDVFTGSLANGELYKYGSIQLVFYKSSHTIFVELCGLCAVQTFKFNPTTKKQQKMNLFFIERYVNNCIDPELLMNQLFSK